MADSLLLPTIFVSEAIQDYYNFFNGLDSSGKAVFDSNVGIIVLDSTGHYKYRIGTDAQGRPYPADTNPDGSPATYSAIRISDNQQVTLTVQADGTLRAPSPSTEVLTFDLSASGVYHYTGTANIFRTGGTADEDAAVQGLDSRIAAFEQVIIDATLPAGSTTYDYPYDAAGLKREFLDEVLALLLSRTYLNETYLTKVEVEVYNNAIDAEEGVNLQSSSGVQSAVISGGTLRDAAVTFTVPAGKFAEVIVDGAFFGFHDNTDSSAALTLTLLPVAKNFDDMTREQKLQLLNDDGKAVYTYYEGLIDLVFAEGEKLKAGPVDPETGLAVETYAVTAIPPVVIDDVTYTHAVTIKVPKDPVPTDPAVNPLNDVIHYIQENTLTTFSVRKVPVLNTAGTVVGFKLEFEGNLPPAADAPVALAVKIWNETTKQFDDISNATPISLPAARMMYADEYLLYWNEARTNILRAQLAYKEAVTREMQEDLRQANEALAELENLAAGVKAPGGTVGADTVTETLKLDLWEARVGKPGEKMFNSAGDDDIHTYAQWQENRTNLKNYIDRKSAQSQQAMLDYQTVLNRYNNAYEVMSKLQEKIDNLIKTQLRNYN